VTIASGDLDGDGRADLLLYDASTGEWTEALTRESGRFDSLSGQWTPGWVLALRP